MYTKEIYKEPFWAENSGFTTGRDPLGIQNSSIATYGRLLPGMTNQTLHMRYYGFFMWVLYEYHNMKKGKDELRLAFHYNFIRRSELILAYMMINQFPDVQSIVGSNFVRTNNENGKKVGFHDIASGADKTKSTVKGSVYWDYSSGALGQYYAGSLINLNLIQSEEGFFIIQEKGKELALAFKENVGDDASDLFLNIVESGRLNRSQLNKLEKFSISKIPSNSKEWKFYLSLLLADDGENLRQFNGKIPSQRKETLKQYLQFIDWGEKTSSEIDFTEYQYQLNLKALQTDVSFGWYYYSLNEKLHYSLESIFWGLLVELDGQIIPIKDFVSKVCNAAIKISSGDYLKGKTRLLKDVLIDLEQSSDTLESDFEELIKSVKYPANSLKSISLAIKIILQTYNENIPYKHYIINYENNNYLNDKKGRAIQVFDDFIEKSKNSPFENYIELFIKSILNDHMVTAYRKMGNGESSLLKFIIEENYITHIQTMEPKFTSPRLGALDNLLTDMGFITPGSKLSIKGNNLLQTLKSS